MKKPSTIPRRGGRTRRLAGWMLFILGVLVAAVWLSCRWWSFTLMSSSGRAVSVQYGAVWYILPDNRLRSGPEGRSSVRRLYNASTVWWFGWTSTMGPAGAMIWYRGLFMYIDGPSGTMNAVQIALWPMPVVLWVASAPFLWSGFAARRRGRIGACTACGYSLIGLEPGSPCPECGGAGAVVDATQP